ncbi:PIR Superfamily Protein [Plasmodium ovale wallikeri]|uniref:PIR Superfamily Protein n=1 Tax=Plasmodium ovale wallikeri TaxID=864142 RepID=A0A1A9AJB9_PLAOA|nr:PIR Superfamily Protein [Plasmodium ovale wallikeri]SBT56300.1 PIR Superfamily Protein [Plasmodium ovale wallikeri]
MECGNSNEDEFPSNINKKFFCEKNDIGELYNIYRVRNGYEDYDSWLENFKNNLEEIYSKIKVNCLHNNYQKCCIYANHFLDYIVGIIKKSQLDISDQNKLIKEIEDKLKQIFISNVEHNCTRKNDLYSTHKRCILKQLRDLFDDKNSIGDETSQYGRYLEDKWNQILKYTNEKDDKLYFKIKNIIDFQYKVADKKINHYLDTASYDEITNYKIPYEVQNILLPGGFSILGFSFIIFLLYKFGPLESWLPSWARKNNSTRQILSEEITENFLGNSENTSNYLSYHSLSY